MSVGKLVAQGSLAELRAATAARVHVDTADTALAASVLAGAGMEPSSVDGVRVVADLGARRPEDLCRALVHAGVGVRGFTVERPSLEDTFVALTGEGFDVAQ
jgi:ABC-2 type transport system ATP-binding protein